MFTVSCYALHPLIQRFVGIWRFVRCVSNWFWFLVSIPLTVLCCACGDAMPLDSSDDGKSAPEAYRMISKPVIEPGRAAGEPFRPQHFVVDFQAQLGDTVETEEKCCHFWQFVNNQPELEGIMVKPEIIKESILEKITIENAKKAKRSRIPSENSLNFPAVHTIKKLNRRDIAKPAFETATSSKCRR